MSNPEHHQDKAKVLAAFGGKKGLIDSGIPSVIASDLYLPKLLTNLGYGSVYLIANLARWPILGLLLGPILGENLQWRKDPVRARAYKRASWLWVGMFFARIAVQYPIYRSGNVNLLGTVNLAMGYPLFLATAYGSWMILKSVPTTKIADK